MLEAQQFAGNQMSLPPSPASSSMPRERRIISDRWSSNAETTAGDIWGARRWSANIEHRTSSVIPTVRQKVDKGTARKFFPRGMHESYGDTAESREGEVDILRDFFCLGTKKRIAKSRPSLSGVAAHELGPTREQFDVYYLDVCTTRTRD